MSAPALQMVAIQLSWLRFVSPVKTTLSPGRDGTQCFHRRAFGAPSPPGVPRFDVGNAQSKRGGDTFEIAAFVVGDYFVGEGLYGDRAQNL